MFWRLKISLSRGLEVYNGNPCKNKFANRSKKFVLDKTKNFYNANNPAIFQVIPNSLNKVFTLLKPINGKNNFVR